ncbi:MAG: type III-B CRISPR module RAMP protein Cmr4 [bacterium]|nr:type III-B CRISPR module RAMP protein Cmr4 [bacterium]
MFEQNKIGFLIAESPIHCGVGQDVGIIDQPIQRERYTNYPRIQGSEIKGVFRQYYKGDDIDAIFGPEKSGEEGGDFASAVSFSDARVLFYPVKSLKDVYVWITCKDVLEKFRRSLAMAGINSIQVPDVEPVENEHIIVSDNSICIGNQVVLEEYLFNKQDIEPSSFDSIIEAIVPKEDEYKYLKESLKKKICIVSDDVFRDFVEMSTEVITRIRIDKNTGVVQEGALWSEEYLPMDTILYFSLFVVKTRDKKQVIEAKNIVDKLTEMTSYIQIGGNETVGKGFVRINWL